MAKNEEVTRKVRAAWVITDYERIVCGWLRPLTAGDGDTDEDRDKDTDGRIYRYSANPKPSPWRLSRSVATRAQRQGKPIFVYIILPRCLAVGAAKNHIYMCFLAAAAGPQNVNLGQVLWA